MHRKTTDQKIEDLRAEMDNRMQALAEENLRLKRSARQYARWSMTLIAVACVGVLSYAWAIDPLVEGTNAGEVKTDFADGNVISAADFNANFKNLVGKTNELVNGVTSVEGRFVASGTPAVSTSSGAGSSFSNTTFATVSGMVASLPSSGNPVLVNLIPDAVVTTSSYLYVSSGSPFSDGHFQIERNGTPICQMRLEAEPTGTNPTLPPGLITCLDDNAPAGTNNYTLSMKTGGSGNIAVQNVRLMATELGHRP